MCADTPRATSSPNHTKSGLTLFYRSAHFAQDLHPFIAQAPLARDIYETRAPLHSARSLIAMRFHILRARDAPPLCAVAIDPRADVRTESEPIRIKATRANRARR